MGYEYINIISKLNNNPNFRHIKNARPVFEKVGWSPNDYWMYTAWFYQDEKVYSRDKLNTIFSDLPKRWRPKNLEHSIIEAKMLKWYLLNSLTSLFLCVLLMPSGHRKLMVLFLVMSGAVVTYIFSTYYLPRQGIVAIVTFLGFSGIFLATKEVEAGLGIKKLMNLKALILLCALVAVSTTCLWQLHNYSIKNDKSNNSIAGFARDLAKKNNLYVVWPLAFPYEYISPFSDLEELSSFHTFPLGYMSHSPVSNEIMKKFGINNLYKALYEKDNVLLMSSPTNLPLLKKFIEEHYGIPLYFRQLLKYNVAGDDMGVYRTLRNSE